MLDSSLFNGLDFSGLNFSGESEQPAWKQSVAPQAPTTPQKRSLLHFESSRAGGTFSLHNYSSWPDSKRDRFRAWKLAPLVQTDECNAMAEEIAARLLSLFGCVMPDCILTKPPRGKTPPDAPHPAELLAQQVAYLLDREYRVTVERAERDTTAHLARSRHTNLADASTFRACGQPVDKLHIIVDDVTTTGSTLARMRSALADVPTLLIVYVTWH